MAETITVPGLGPQPKKVVLIAGGGAAILVIVLVVRKRRAAAADASSATPAAIDPATGLIANSPEDIAALNAQNGYANQGGNGGGGNGGGGGGGNDNSNVIATNAQWTQAAIAYLSGTVGHSESAVSAALGKYINGHEVVKGSTDDTLIAEAIAAEGPPPVNGPNGYPPSVRHTTAAPPPKPPATKPSLPAPTLRIAKHTKHGTVDNVELSWSKVPHATHYTVTKKIPGKGTASFNSVATSHGVTGPGEYFVVAVAGTGYRNSSPSNHVSAT